jgi:hypothetical protein
MGLYQKKNRFIHFIHIPKCAGRSVRKILENEGWVDVTPETPDHLKNEIRKEDLQNSGHSHRKIWSEWNVQVEYQFSIVRNPYDRLRSHLSQVSKGLKFSSIDSLLHVQWFLDQGSFLSDFKTEDGLITGGIGFADNHWRPQVDFLGPETDVYKLENDIDLLMTSLKKRKIISNNSIFPKLGSSPDEVPCDLPWGNFLRTHENFINFYELDFDLFQYRKYKLEDLKKMTCEIE